MLVPNTHSMTIERSHGIPGPSILEVNPWSSSETPENISIFPGEPNQLRVNLTVVSESGALSEVHFKLFSIGNYQTCLGSQNSGCLVNRNISNDSLTLPLTASSTYYFVLDNTGSPIPKKVSLLASVVSTSVQTSNLRDGSLNYTGLGLSIIGFLLAVYGLSKKTVIPWE